MSAPARQNRRLLKSKGARVIFWLSLFALFFLYSALTGFQCVFLRYFHVICPGCGMTRAVRALLRLDLAGAWRFHPMVFSMPLLVLYIALDGRVFRKKAVNILVLSLTGAGFAVNYAIKLVAFFSAGGAV